MYWAWLSLSLVARIGFDVTSNAGKHKGYVNNLLCKLIHSHPPFPAHILVWWVSSSFIDRFMHLGKLLPIVIWGSYIGLVIDDYLNGDDDFHKKIKKALNKIKWKMTQPRLIPRPE